MAKPIELIIIVGLICAWGAILLLHLNSWGREIIRKIETTRLTGR